MKKGWRERERWRLKGGAVSMVDHQETTMKRSETKKKDSDDFDVHMSSRSSVAVGTWVQ